VERFPPILMRQLLD